jgi:hypothetical protein
MRHPSQSPGDRARFWRIRHSNPRAKGMTLGGAERITRGDIRDVAVDAHYVGTVLQGTCLFTYQVC